MRLDVILPLTLLAHAASSSAIPTLPTHATSSANPLQKRETKVLNILLEEYTIDTCFFTDCPTLKRYWLHYTTKQGTNAGCAANSREAGKIGESLVDDTDPKWAPGTNLPAWPAGSYRLDNLYGNGLKGDAACRYKNDGLGNPGAIWCGSTFLSMCWREDAVSNGKTEWMECSGERRLPYVRCEWD
jgi:hypothetical protein